MQTNLIHISAVGIFSALALAGGYFFIAVPNVEIFTAIIFLSGLILGPQKGMLVGLIAQSLFSTLNPYGVSPPPLFVAQVLNRVLVGYVGGRFDRFSGSKSKFKRTALFYGIAGLLLAWLYDLMAYFSFFFMSGFSMQQMKVTFALGLPWYMIHGLGNALVFAFVLPFVARGIRRIEAIQIG